MKSLIGAATAAGLMISVLAGCATITQGTTQNIAVTTSPTGGRCDLSRNGNQIASVDSAPAKVHVDKTKYDILVTCHKAGYQPASVNLESGYSLGVFGNAIIGGAIGWGIDSATGADNEYPSTANVQLVPLRGDAATLMAARSLCTPEEQELATTLAQNLYSTVKLVCD